MKKPMLAILLFLPFMASAVPRDDPPPQEPTRTHVDTTVVDDSAPSDGKPLTSEHHFEAGAPDIVKVTDQLKLSPQQKARISGLIERADAGAAVLIKREQDVRDMLGATTPEDPMYAKLVADQATGEDRWKDNREGLKRDVLEVLTPAQRARFEELTRTP